MPDDWGVVSTSPSAAGEWDVVSATPSMQMAPNHIPAGLQGGPDNAPHGFWQSLAANNPITATYHGVKEYLHRPGEFAKADQALGVLQSKPSGGFNDAENATIDAGMNANLPGAEDSGIPLAGPAMGAMQQAGNGDLAGAAGTLTGSYLAPAVTGKLISKVPNPIPPGLKTPEGRTATTRAGIEALPNGSKALKFIDILRKGPEATITPADLADYAKKSGITVDQLNAMKPDELTKFIDKATDAVKVMKANEVTRASVADELAPKSVLRVPPRMPTWESARSNTVATNAQPFQSISSELPSGRKPGGYNPANDSAPTPTTAKPTVSATLPKPPTKTPADIVIDYSKDAGINSDQLANMSPEQFQEFASKLAKAHKQKELQQQVIGRIRVNETSAPTAPTTLSGPPSPESAISEAIDNLNKGGHVLVRQIRTAVPSIDKATFDATMQKLAQSGKFDVAKHDAPYYSTPEQLNEMLPLPNGEYGVAVGVRPNPAPSLPPTPGMVQRLAHKTKDTVDSHVENKKANLADYMATKGITPEAASAMSIEERNQVLKDAHAHGKAKGVSVPKTGYKPFDPTNTDTWDQAVEMLKSYQLTPPPV